MKTVQPAVVRQPSPGLLRAVLPSPPCATISILLMLSAPVRRRDKSEDSAC